MSARELCFHRDTRSRLHAHLRKVCESHSFAPFATETRSKYSDAEKKRIYTLTPEIRVSDSAAGLTRLAGCNHILKSDDSGETKNWRAEKRVVEAFLHAPALLAHRVTKGSEVATFTLTHLTAILTCCCVKCSTWEGKNLYRRTISYDHVVSC